jgi:hypothetical protein
MKLENNLLEFTQKSILPSVDQVKLLSSIQEFLDSDDKIFLMKGYAGTGKTTIAKYLAGFLHNERIETHLAAFTGRATQILSMKTGFEANTIHKTIYNLDELNEELTGTEDQKKFKFRYGLISDIPANIRRVYIIDESSMISNTYTEDDFFVFGSGYLLNDLIEHVGIKNTSRQDKIIFIGDPAQLPPVNDRESSALTSSYFESKYGTTPREYTLTEIKRQSEGSAILDNATMLRDLLKSKHRNSLKFITNNEVKEIETTDVVDSFMKEFDKENIEKNVIVNYTNKDSFNINLDIKEKINSRSEICQDDVLMGYSNNYNYHIDIYNGTICKVLSVSPNPEIFSNLFTWTLEGEKTYVTLAFRDVRLSIKHKDKWEIVECKILESFLFKDTPRIDYSEQVALYLDFKKRNSSLKPRTKEFKDALKADKYFNALKVKFGYAITCHKAQGGEWKNTIVNLACNQGKTSDMYLRFAYTSITRASEKLLLFNVPSVSQFSKFKFTLYRITRTNPSGDAINFVLPENFGELLEKYNLSKSDYKRIVKFKEILAICSQFQIEIISRKEELYKDTYIFCKDENTGTLIFNVKGNGEYSTINPRNASSEVDRDLKAIFDKSYVISIVESYSEKPTYEYTFDEEIMDELEIENPNFRNLYIELKSIFDEKNILIKNVDHKDNYDLYTFKKGAESAVIQFYRDDRASYSRSNVMPALSKDAEILEELNDGLISFQTRVNPDGK